MLLLPMDISGLAASLAVSVSVWLCTKSCVCSMWWALATFSPPSMVSPTVKLPHPTRACLGGWVQKLLPPALLSGHYNRCAHCVGVWGNILQGNFLILRSLLMRFSPILSNTQPLSSQGWLPVAPPNTPPPWHTN